MDFIGLSATRPFRFSGNFELHIEPIGFIMSGQWKTPYKIAYYGFVYSVERFNLSSLEIVDAYPKDCLGTRTKDEKSS